MHGDGLLELHVAELGLLEVGGDPDIVEGDQGHERLTNGDVLADFNAFGGDDAGDGGTELGVIEIQLRLRQRGAGLLDLAGGLIGFGLLDGNLLRSGLGVFLRGLRLQHPIVGNTHGILRGNQVGFRFGDAGFIRSGCRHGGVVLLFGDDVFLDEGGIALEIELRLGGVSLRLSNARLRGLELFL